MDTEKYYYEIQETSSITEDVLFHCKQEKILWENKNNLTITKVPKEITHKQNLISSLENVFGGVTCVVFKFIPNICYNWHKDALRSSAINLELTKNDDSLVIFGTQVDPDNFRIECKIPYEKHKFYLINTSEYHQVINMKKTRYVLSVVFEENFKTLDKNLCKYDQLYSYLTDNKL